jgi:hypothetical protein
MKTATNNTSLGIKIQIAILILTLLALFNTVKGSIITIADIPAPIKEATVNDIPFDTHEIAVEYFFEQAMDGVSIPADTDVNDIPFNTKLIQQLNLAKYSNVLPELPAEKSVNDIPFDTHEIVQQYRIAKLNGALALKAECTVNDIPFESNVVLAQLVQEKKAPAKFNMASNLPDHVINRLVNLVKAGLISILILLSAGILGFLFFSYVY